jgi:hypothetical protein
MKYLQRHHVSAGLLRCLSAALMLVVLTLGASAAGAAASPSAIERTWSFNGGEVAIQAQPGGAFLGTVVVPTKFSQCVHPVGEPMWTAITRQPDGSYWGLHRWFYETAECVANPTPGPTAWRVMEAADGAAYLLVCFSAPGGPQPRIASDGATADVSYGCVKSAEVAPVTGVESFTKSVLLPSNRKCLSRRVFQIHLHQSKYDPFKAVTIAFAKHKLTVQRRGNVFAATINLKGLPRGTFTVRIHVATVLGHRLSGSRTYHTCVAKAPRSRRARSRR